MTALSKRAVRNQWAAAFAVTALCVSCAEDEDAKSGPRHETIPVHGQVLVNGNPMAGIVLRLVPEKEHEQISSSRGRIVTQAVTDEEGNFRAFTYKTGDGAPPGKYKVLLWYRTRQRLSGENRKSNDHFKNKYADPETSQYSVEVKPDDEGPIVMDTINLEVTLGR